MMRLVCAVFVLLAACGDDPQEPAPPDAGVCLVPIECSQDDCTDITGAINPCCCEDL